MTAKIWGGVLIGVFVAAAGAELIRRRCPGLVQNIAESKRKMCESTCEGFGKFMSSATSAFQEGYASATN